MLPVARKEKEQGHLTPTLFPYKSQTLFSINHSFTSVLISKPAKDDTFMLYYCLLDRRLELNTKLLKIVMLIFYM